MRILIFNWRDITHPWTGGAEMNVHEQARRWVRAGHQVTLFCGAYIGSDQRANIDGIEIVRRGGRFTVYLWAAVYYLRYFRGKYDVLVDLENGIPFFTPLYSRIPKVCIAHHVHTEQFHTEFSPPLSWIGIFLESVVMPLVYRRVPFITISQSSRTELARIGINPERCSVVYCGLDHDQYRPGQAKAQQPLLICLGRLMRYKRVDMLIRLMVPIVEEHPDAVLHVVGFGPENELKRIVDQYGLGDHVVFHGRVSEGEKIRWLQQAWVLVTASMKEGWGLVAVEANACGTPAVAFSVPGLCEAIDHSHSGLLAESEEEFVKAVLRILEDGDFRDRLSRAAVKRAEQFNWDETATQSLGILLSEVNCAVKKGQLGVVPSGRMRKYHRSTEEAK
jgi:glycosyltransferase involved in cell wall biosynthesis